jgi:Zn-dependent peptidase ImmA (M78 family)
VAEELIASQEKQDMLTAYAAAKVLIPESTISKKIQRQQQKENTTLINISKQLDKQTAEIKRIGSILQSIQKHIKLLERQRSEFMKQIQKQTSQIQKYVTQKKKRKEKLI